MSVSSAATAVCDTHRSYARRFSSAERMERRTFAPLPHRERALAATAHAPSTLLPSFKVYLEAQRD